MISIRGDGKGVRPTPFLKKYDCDTYNDLGNPDKGIDLAGPTLLEDLKCIRCRTGC